MLERPIGDVFKVGNTQYMVVPDFLVYVCRTKDGRRCACHGFCLNEKKMEPFGLCTSHDRMDRTSVIFIKT